MIIRIRIKPVKNGFIVTFFRGIWQMEFAKCVAKDEAEILELISKEFKTSLLEVNRNDPTE
jgi:hypothetical protein